MPAVTRYGRPMSREEAWAVQRQKDWKLKRWNPRSDLPGYLTTENGSHFYTWGRVLVRAYPVLKELERDGHSLGRSWIVGGWSYDKYGLNETEAFAILAPEGDPVRDFRPPPKRILGFTVDEWMSSIVGGADAEVIVGARAGAKVGLRVATLAEVRASLNAGVASAKVAPAEADYAAREFAVKQRELLDTAHADLIADQALGLSAKEADLLRVEGELETNARFWDEQADTVLSKSPQGRQWAREYAQRARDTARAARDRRSAEFNEQHTQAVENMEARGDNMLKRLENELNDIEGAGGTTAQQFARYENVLERYQKELDAFNASPSTSASEARARIKRSQNVKNRLKRAEEQRDLLRAKHTQDVAKVRQQYEAAEQQFGELAQEYFRKSAEAKLAGDEAASQSLQRMADDFTANAARYKQRADTVGDQPLPDVETVTAEVEAAVKEVSATLRTRTASVGGATIDAKTVFVPVVGPGAPLVPAPTDLVEDVEEEEQADTSIPRAEIDTALHLVDVVDTPGADRRLAGDVADTVQVVEKEGARALVTTLRNGEQWVVFSGLYGEDGPDYPDEVTRETTLPGVLEYMMGNTNTKPPGADRFGTSLFGEVLETLTGFDVRRVLTPLHAHITDLRTALGLPDGSPVDVQGVAQVGVCRLLSVIFDDVANLVSPEAVVKVCGFGIGGSLAQLFALKHLLESNQKVDRIFSIGAPRTFETFGSFLSDSLDIVSIMHARDPFVQGYGSVLGHTGRKLHITDAGFEYLPEQALPEGSASPKAAFLDMVQKQRTTGTPRRLQVTALAFGALRNAGWTVGEAAAGAAAAEVGTTVAPLAAGEEVKRTERWIHDHEHAQVVDLADAGVLPQPSDITRGSFNAVSEALQSGALDLAAIHSPKGYAEALAALPDAVTIPHGTASKPWADLVPFVKEPEAVGEQMGWTEGIDAYLRQFATGDVPTDPHDVAAPDSGPAEYPTTQRVLTGLMPAGFVLYDTKNAAAYLNNFITY